LLEGKKKRLRYCPVIIQVNKTVKVKGKAHQRKRK